MKDEQYVSRLLELQKAFKPREFTVVKPDSEFPELFITVPDSWPYIKLAPLYDVHYGHALHASTSFIRHIDWMTNEPYVLCFNGGDLVENAVLGSPGIFSQKFFSQEQHDGSVELVAPFQHKLLFGIPGNHEYRTLKVTGYDLARQFATDLQIPYFPDYCFCTIKWRGNNFRICAHHGTGAAQTPGGQRNAARKDMPWVKADIYWTGHLHQPMADLIFQADFDQKTGNMVTRNTVAIISPSYLQYFGGYGAAKRLSPGVTGIIPVTLQEDGRIDVSLHAKGKRL
jgi:hypothetical protein